MLGWPGGPVGESFDPLEGPPAPRAMPCRSKAGADMKIEETWTGKTASICLREKSREKTAGAGIVFVYEPVIDTGGLDVAQIGVELVAQGRRVLGKGGCQHLPAGNRPQNLDPAGPFAQIENGVRHVKQREFGFLVEHGRNHLI